MIDDVQHAHARKNGWMNVQHGRVQYVHQATGGHYIVD